LRRHVLEEFYACSEGASSKRLHGNSGSKRSSSSSSSSSSRATARSDYTVALERDVVVTGLTCAMWPASFLYYFLYYTDTASSLLLLLVYWLTVRTSASASAGGVGRGGGASGIGSAIMLGCCASMAILVRQTNAAWVLFCAGVHVLQQLRALGSYADGGKGINSRLSLFPRALWAQKWRLLLPTGAGSSHIHPSGQTHGHRDGALRFWALLLPVVAFIVYVVKFNSGHIVVGDVSAHQPVLHWAMLLHAAALVCAVMLPCVLGSAFFACESEFNEENGERKLLAAAASLALHAAGAALCSLTLLYSSHAHPYLLADNRHYTFYVWARFLQYPTRRALLGVLYYAMFVATFKWMYAHFCAGTSTRMLSRGSCSESERPFPLPGPRPVWALGFGATALATLVPTPLLEPRYFTPVVLLAILHAPPLFTTRISSSKRGTDAVTTTAAATTIAVPWFAYSPLFCFIVLNTAVVAIFLFRPYQWPDGSTARFMW